MSVSRMFRTDSPISGDVESVARLTVAACEPACPGAVHRSLACSSAGTIPRVGLHRRGSRFRHHLLFPADFETAPHFSPSLRVTAIPDRTLVAQDIPAVLCSLCDQRQPQSDQRQPQIHRSRNGWRTAFRQNALRQNLRQARPYASVAFPSVTEGGSRKLPTRPSHSGNRSSTRADDLARPRTPPDCRAQGKLRDLPRRPLLFRSIRTDSLAASND